MLEKIGDCLSQGAIFVLALMPIKSFLQLFIIYFSDGPLIFGDQATLKLVSFLVNFDAIGLSLYYSGVLYWRFYKPTR